MVSMSWRCARTAVPASPSPSPSTKPPTARTIASSAYAPDRRQNPPFGANAGLASCGFVSAPAKGAPQLRQKFVLAASRGAPQTPQNFATAGSSVAVAAADGVPSGLAGTDA